MTGRRRSLWRVMVAKVSSAPIVTASPWTCSPDLVWCGSRPVPTTLTVMSRSIRMPLSLSSLPQVSRATHAEGSELAGSVRNAGLGADVFGAGTHEVA